MTPNDLEVARAIGKADVLTEALSYIRAFRGCLVVVKLGGSCIEDLDALDSTLQDVLFLETVGLRPILVHGGGKAISSAMAQAGLVPTFVDGRRYTDNATLKIVTEVLTHTICDDLVARVEKLGGWAMGLYPPRTPCLFGRRLTHDDRGHAVDLGHVGEVVRVDEGRLRKLCNAGIIPVLPSVAVGDDGGYLNVNADTAAASIAEYLRAEKLVFISDTPGILADPSNEDSLLRSLSDQDCYRLIDSGVIDGGMIPKVEACIRGLKAGVGKTHMIDGRVPHALLLEIYTRSGIGTEISLGRQESS